MIASAPLVPADLHGTGPNASAGPATSPDLAADLDAAELAARLRLSVTRLARRLRQEAEIGLSPSLLSALAMIHVHGPLTLGALAELEGVAPPTVTKVVNRLEEQDLVQRIVDGSDKRVCRVVPTEQGDALLAASRERKNAWLAARLESLDAVQVEHLAAAVVALEALAAGESTARTPSDGGSR